MERLAEAAVSTTRVHPLSHSQGFPAHLLPRLQLKADSSSRLSSHGPPLPAPFFTDFITNVSLLAN